MLSLGADELTRVHDMWAREKEVWEGEKRTLERKVHISESRLKMIMDELFVAQANLCVEFWTQEAACFDGFCEHVFPYRYAGIDSQQLGWVPVMLTFGPPHPDHGARYRRFKNLTDIHSPEALSARRRFDEVRVQ